MNSSETALVVVWVATGIVLGFVAFTYISPMLSAAPAAVPAA